LIFCDYSKKTTTPEEASVVLWGLYVRV
jgi:hypothetical protein